MQSHDELMSRARCADSEAARWEKMAAEAEDNAKRYRKYAKQRLADAFDYRELAERSRQEMLKALEGIAA